MLVDGYGSVLDDSCHFRIVVATFALSCGRFLGLLMVLYGVGWFWRVLYCSGRFWPDLWIDFWRSSLN